MWLLWYLLKMIKLNKNFLYGRRKHLYKVCFPGGSVNKESTCNEGPWVRFLGWEYPLETGMQPTPVFLPGESPCIEERRRLYFIGSQRAGHGWATKHTQHTQNKNIGGMMVLGFASYRYMEIILKLYNPELAVNYLLRDLLLHICISNDPKILLYFFSQW